MDKKAAMGRHPSGKKLVEVAEASPHSLGWALVKSAELATEAERKAITDWLRSRRASEPMRLTIERLAYLIDQGKHLEQNKEKGENK
jgi:hypothetical protein